MRHPELVGADLDPPARCTRGNPVRQAYATHVLCATDICNKVNGGEAGIRSRQVSAKHRYAIFCSVASRHLDPRGCGYPEDTPAVEPYGFSSLAGRYSMRKHGVRGSIMYWRRGRDSNPGYRLTRHNGFRDRRIQPLCHLSAKSRNYATRRSV